MKDGFIGKSTQAYTRVYPKIASALSRNEKVTIEIIDLTAHEKVITNKVTDEMISVKTVYEKLQTINGNITALNAKIDGRTIK